MVGCELCDLCVKPCRPRPCRHAQNSRLTRKYIASVVVLCASGTEWPGANRMQVSERTKTAEELAELERQRLEALEARRQKRMRAGTDEADDAGHDVGPDEVAPSGGYKARRLKRQRGQTHVETGPSGARCLSLLGLGRKGLGTTLAV